MINTPIVQVLSNLQVGLGGYHLVSAFFITLITRPKEKARLQAELNHNELLTFVGDFYQIPKRLERSHC